MIIDTEKMVRVGDLAEELKASLATVRGLVADVPNVKMGTARFYERDAVKAALRERNKHLLRFLGVRPESESYDTNISAAAELSGEQE